jgi:hypothetical protein
VRRPGKPLQKRSSGPEPENGAAFNPASSRSSTSSQMIAGRIVPDITSLCSKVDAVLLENVDGLKHLEQVREIVKARRPMFIDAIAPLPPP